MRVEMLPVLIVPQLSDLLFIHGTQAPKQSKIIPEVQVVLVISQRAGDAKSSPLTHWCDSSKNASYPLPCSVLLTLFEVAQPGTWYSGSIQSSLLKSEACHHPETSCWTQPYPLDPEERLWKIRVENNFLQLCLE